MVPPQTAATEPATAPEPREGTPRRHFLGYLLAAPTLVVAAKLGGELLSSDPAGAAIVSPPEPADLFDLGDLLTMAASPTSGMITIVLNTDGTVSFALPRAEVGQGLTTAVAMLIADEIGLDLPRVDMSLADARPELIWNQLTGGSNSIRSLYQPVRHVAAVMRARVITVAAKTWGVPVGSVTITDGIVRSASGRSADIGSFAAAAAVQKTTTASASLKPTSQFTLVGKPQNRIDAHAAVTGTKVYTMDLQIPNALPTMVCRPPTINGTVRSVANLAAVRAMPGVTHVVAVSTGVAVRAATFGQCIDAVRALSVSWGPGTEDGRSDADIEAELHKAEIPLVAPPLTGLTKAIESTFTFSFASNSPLETNCAIADVRPGSAEIWSSLKSPITAQEKIAELLKLKPNQVSVHVMQGGGSFGRHLFWDAAIEAAEISKAMGVPVKLMWHRTDDFRHGRTHPMSISHVRATYAGKNVLTYEQRHTSVSTDFTHGLGEIITAYAAELPFGNLGFSETVFELSQTVSYNFGVTDQLLNEVDMGFHTGSMRNIYSPNVRVAQELMADQLAAAMGMDRYAFRKQFAKDARTRAVLETVATQGQWGRSLPAGVAQGIAVHGEYKGVTAALVELDCRPATVSRPITDGVTGPRVTRVTFAVDVGLAVNPKGLEAQMLGGIMDGIALALTSSLHIKNGIPLEGSWDNYFYTRQWNLPLEVNIIVMPTTTGQPGGAGELGVAAAFAAVASAYGAATGTMPTRFPINHDGPLAFTPLPTVPPIPQSPTDGLQHTF